jgi:hypothetical protein
MQWCQRTSSKIKRSGRSDVEVARRARQEIAMLIPDAEVLARNSYGADAEEATRVAENQRRWQTYLNQDIAEMEAETDE